jgi:hypothetical protein
MPGTRSKKRGPVYEAIDQSPDDEPAPRSSGGSRAAAAPQPSSGLSVLRSRRAAFIAGLTCLIIGFILILAFGLRLLPSGFSGDDDDDCPCLPSKVPQYFQTSPELWAGPTATGKAAFLAQTRTFDPTGASYVPNQPLQTTVPIEGMETANRSIFEMMGYVVHQRCRPAMCVCVSCSLYLSVIYRHMLHLQVSAWMSTRYQQARRLSSCR